MSESSPLYERALRLLGRRAHSRVELRRKLAGAPEQLEVVLDRLQQEGYIDDGKFAAALAAERRRKQWSDRAIRTDLKRRGVADAIVRRTLNRLDAEAGEEQALQAWVAVRVDRRGAPQTPVQLKKLYDACVRRGFPGAMARKVLEPYFKKLDWRGSGGRPKL